MRIRLAPLGHAVSQAIRAHAGRLPTPLKINLCLTYWCQYRCKTCNIWRRKPTDELTTEELLTFIRLNKDTSWVDVTGGEIFLRPDVETILLAVVREWSRLALLHFPTNGFLTDRIVSITEKLAVARKLPILVTVSLDGDRALNDEIRGIKGGYVHQVATFNALRQIRGVRPVFGFTLSRHNVGHLRETFDACRADCPGLTLDDFHVNVAQQSGHYYGTDASTDIAARPDDVRRELDWYVRSRGLPHSPGTLIEARYMQLLDRFLTTGRTPMPCHALRSSCFIDPWGTVYPCITYSKPLGNLRETGMDLRPIWASTAVSTAQAEIWRGQCPQCWTACEAYQTILGNLLAPWRADHPSNPAPVPTDLGKRS